MKSTLLFLSILFCGFASAQVTILDFEDDNLPLDIAVTASTTNPDSSFVFSGLEFPSFYNPAYGGFWAGGWALSTSRNDTVGDFSNLTGAVTGEGFDNSNSYLVGQNGAYILLPAGSEFAKLYVTNTTYTANVLENGSGFSRPFGIDTSGLSGVPDSLVLAVTGYSNGEVSNHFDFYLADYRAQVDSNDYILREWRANDHFLPAYSFSPADSIAFRMYSSDNGAFGNNTPDFFAIDNLHVIIGVSSTRNLIETKPLKVWPNPASDVIHLGESGEIVQLHIADMNGRLLRFYPSYNLGETLNLSALPSGQYIAVAMGNGFESAAQIVVK